MIRIVMLGRLGNNLFQYAYGRVLAEKHGVPLLMDASWFNHRTWPYVSPLQRFPGFQNGSATLRRPFNFGSRLLKKITKKHHWEYFGKPIIREPELDQSFQPELLDSPSDCVIFGYFQTPWYFRGYESKLRNELSTEHLRLERGYENLASQISKPHTVAVHVRRTDYVNNRNLHCLGIDYYQRAMNHLRERHPGLRFYVFSDDIAWCAAHLSASDVELMTHGDPFNPLLDLHLMSLASHHIIANSSYSWWAAWLGDKPGQQVLMPDAWFHSTIHAPIAEKIAATHWHPIATQCSPSPQHSA